MTKVSFNVAGEPQPVEVSVTRGDAKDRDAFTVTIRGAASPVELETTASGAGWIRHHGRVQPFRVIRKDDTIDVWLDGRVHTLKTADRSPRRSTSGATLAARADLTAPMPGTILQIHVKPGDAFAAHAPLVVMESMKMEMTLSAPHDGRVKEVRCKAGQLVEMGAVLVNFAEEGNGDAAE